MPDFILTFGICFLLGSALAILFKALKQSTILSYIITGFLLGLFKDQIHLPQEIIDIFTELGIIFLLFMAGMEISLKLIKAKWKLTLINGLGQIVLTTGLGFLLGLKLLNLSNYIVAVYFGLCLTFSSTIIVISLLKTRKEIDSFHGQILIGLLILQDIVAVLALVVLNSLTGEGSFLLSMAFVIGKASGLVVFLFLLSRYVLAGIFKKFAESAELLFIGSLGWVLGISALCEFIHFSPEIGAFLAGVSLISIPYKLEIEDKVEPIKNFGIILFFVALGYNLDIEKEIIGLIPAILIVSVFVLLATPIIMAILGFFERLRRRPVVFMGFMLNQISEFSLILATLCFQAGIFNNNEFIIVTFSSILTILISSIGHSKIDSIQNLMKTPFYFIEKHARNISLEEQLTKFKTKDHIVIFGYNSIAQEISDKLNNNGLETLIFDYDPSIYHQYMDKKNDPKIRNKIFVYADATDPDTWEDFKFKDASLIISCLVKNHEAEIRLLEKLKEETSNAVTVITANSIEEGINSYRHGATLVIFPNLLAGQKMAEILLKVAPDWNFLEKYGIEIKDSIFKDII